MLQALMRLMASPLSLPKWSQDLIKPFKLSLKEGRLPALLRVPQVWRKRGKSKNKRDEGGQHLTFPGVSTPTGEGGSSQHPSRPSSVISTQ